MRYENLSELIRGSSSSHQYFLSLSTGMQLSLHAQNDQIHTAEDLRRYAAAAKSYIIPYYQIELP